MTRREREVSCNISGLVPLTDLLGLVLAWEIGSEWQPEVRQITCLLTLYLSACVTSWSWNCGGLPQPCYHVLVTEQGPSDGGTDRPVRGFLHLPHGCEFPWTEAFSRQTALLGFNKAQTFDF